MDGFKALFNFDNIGGKIKTFTKWYCWISIIIVWVACGILLLLGLSDLDLVGLYWGIAIPSAVFVPLTTWLSCWVLYAFGELVENSAKIAKGNSAPQAEPEIVKPVQPQPTSAPEQAPISVKNEKILSLLQAKANGTISQEQYQETLKKWFMTSIITEEEFSQAYNM